MNRDTSPTAGPIPVVAPVTSVDALDEVFGGRGDAARCWCQWDRLPNARYRAMSPAEGRELFVAWLAEGGPGPGVVATLGDERVGWCAVAPRSSFPRLAGRRTTSSPQTAADDPGIWSVTCFTVRTGFRRRGIAEALLDGAVRHARSGGARWLEAYPVDTGGERAPAANLYRGTLSLFQAAGFEVVARPLPGRAVVRLELRP